jgi:hypothetical protein
MTIRIDSIRQKLTDAGYQWELSVKGLYGQGIYFTASTGMNGEGLYATANAWEIAVGAGRYPEVESLSMFRQPTIRLVESDRFTVHTECDAAAVVHRVAAALVMLGWGPEWIDDRDAISGRTTITASIEDYRRKGSVTITP